MFKTNIEEWYKIIIPICWFIDVAATNFPLPLSGLCFSAICIMMISPRNPDPQPTLESGLRFLGWRSWSSWKAYEFAISFCQKIRLSIQKNLYSRKFLPMVVQEADGNKKKHCAIFPDAHFDRAWHLHRVFATFIRNNDILIVFGVPWMHGRRKDFFQGDNSGEIWFYRLDTKRTILFAEILIGKYKISKFRWVPRPPHLPTPMPEW